MTWDRALVDIVGLALIAFIVWFFWLVKAKGVRAAATTSGYQEQMVLVKGGYTPAMIVVQAGKPVRLNFVRQESASCIEMVLLRAFNKSAKLSEGETVPVEFLPKEPGEFRVRVPDGDVPGEGDRGVSFWGPRGALDIAPGDTSYALAVGRGGLLIGEVAARNGVSRKALRLCETAGTLPHLRRPTCGYRLYGREALALLSFVS